MDAAPIAGRRLVVLVPVFNDWQAVSMLLAEIDLEASRLDWSVAAVLVDDGSTQQFPPELRSKAYDGLEAIRVIRLRRNLGHQRAIAIGLAWLNSEAAFDAVVVMDGDGEDDPTDIRRLLANFDKMGGGHIVFAERARRAEGLAFRFFYRLYRVLHRALTGVAVRVGNYSILPAEAVDSLVTASDLWNHFSASIFKARLPFVTVPTARRRRLTGSSKMNFTSLVVHGLSAISVFGERVGIRGMVFASSFLLLTAFLLVLVVTVRTLTSAAIPGWASLSSGLLLLVALQLLIGVTIFSFIVLASRESSSFLPVRDHGYFVRSVTSLWNTRRAELRRAGAADA